MCTQIRSSFPQPTGQWLGSWWHQQDSLCNYCSRRSVRGTRLHSEAHSLWLWFRNVMQEQELWLHRLPNFMYTILCLQSWTLVFEQANYCQSNWWQWRRCRRCRGRHLNLHNLHRSKIYCYSIRKEHHVILQRTGRETSNRSSQLQL